jgi:inner membrane protein
MMGKNHLWYGVSAGAAAAVLALTGHVQVAVQVGWGPLRGSLSGGPAGPADAAWLVAASAVGSLVPDFDEPGSMISNAPRITGGLARRLLRRLGVGPLRPLTWLAGIAVLAVATTLNWVSRFCSSIFRLLALGHREGSHWVPVWLGASAGIYLLTAASLGIWPAAGFALGFLTHLVADGLTKVGLPLIPSARLRLHLLPRPLRIRTGSSAETAVTVAYTVALGAALGVALSCPQGLR